MNILRFKRTGFVAIVLIAALPMGCGGPLIQVKRVKPPDSPTQSVKDCETDKTHSCELPGVPFYAVGYRCVHSTVWLEPVYAVTLVISSDDKTALPVQITETKVFGRRELESACTPMTPCVRATLAKLQNNTRVATQQEVQTFVDEFKNLPEMDPLRFDTSKILDPNSPEHDEVVLASNMVTPERYVDANAVHYYNIKKPWAGSANAEVDLSDEGILSKASGQTESKTLETLLSVLPISDLIKGAVGVAVGPPVAQARYKLDLQVQSKVYKHTRSAPVPNKVPPCAPVPALVGADGGAFNFTVEDATEPRPAPGKTQKDTKKEDGDQ